MHALESKARETLVELIGKDKVIFTPRGNKAILFALRCLKKRGRKSVFVQDQGGWITYLQYPQKLGLELNFLKTDCGLINDYYDFKEQLVPNSIVIINSMPGYFALQDMRQIESICREKGCFLINDASGSIGRPEARFGDLVLGSFGKSKPVNLNSGGFLATDDTGLSKDIEKEENGIELDFELLCQKLDNLDSRLELFNQARKRIIKELKDFEILHVHEDGINVIVCFDDEGRKKEIEKYCEKQGYEFTECPRYIRVKQKAISIEVKRLV